MDKERIEITTNLIENRGGELDDFRLRWEGVDVSIIFRSPNSNWASTHGSEHPENYLWRLISGKHDVHTNIVNLLRSGKTVYCEVSRKK
ncbi:MAG: hypothetical protein L7S56_05265 [Candidatus Poseidonia sp.]|nr:hypothetical protein [Poseidonia sp.]